MEQVRQDSRFGARLTRRTALRGAAAASVAGAFALRGGRDIFARQATPAAAEYPEVVIVATDYAFEVPETFEGGVVRLTLDNQGVMDHHAMFMRVNDDATVEDVQAALMEPSFEPVFAVSASAGGPMAAPGMKASVIADLAAGSYVLICAIPGPDGMPHYAMGMQAVVEVTEASAIAERPVTDGKVELMEMMFHGLAPDLAAGTHTWEVVNAGAAIHELIVMQLAPGFTADQFMEILAAPEGATPEGEAAPSGPPPFTMVGGVAPMNPEHTNYLPLDLVAGEYVAICFVPDPATGAPHAALGMVMPFTVA
jgi:uncharacterized cupredoxin-like copper-binding protein